MARRFEIATFRVTRLPGPPAKLRAGAGAGRADLARVFPSGVQKSRIKSKSHLGPINPGAEPDRVRLSPGLKTSRARFNHAVATSLGHRSIVRLELPRDPGSR